MESRVACLAIVVFLFLCAAANAQNYRTISTFAGPPASATPTGGFAGDGGPATSAQLQGPKALVADAVGNLYIADVGNNRIRKVAPNGVITTFAGSGEIGFSGDGGPADAAQFKFPQGLAVDSTGNVFIVDTGNSRIRKVTPDGIITTVAGGGDSVSDGVSGTAFLISTPVGIAVDSAGNVFFGDLTAGRIRKLSPDGIITTLPGPYQRVSALAVDGAGNLFVAETGGQLLKVSLDGTLQNLGIYAAFIGGTPRIPTALALDSAGNLYVSDANLMRILQFGPDNSVRLAAGAVPGVSGDGGLAVNAAINDPEGLAADTSGNIYVSEGSNNRVRKITPVANQVFFSISANTGWTLQTSGGMDQTVTGYATIPGNATAQAAAGLAIFGFRQNAVLVTEAGVPASPTLLSGRIFAELNGTVNTGIALANPNDQPATVSFFFTDAQGDSHSGNLTIAGRSQLSTFLDQAPFNGPSQFAGTFTFSSSPPIAAIALRGTLNERSEFIITTLPVVDLTVRAAGTTVVFPHFADGGGWTSQIVLVNPSDSAVSGTVQLFDQAGQSATLTVDGQPASSLSYSIPAKGFQRFSTSGSGAAPVSGSARVAPSSGRAIGTDYLLFSIRRCNGQPSWGCRDFARDRISAVRGDISRLQHRRCLLSAIRIRHCEQLGGCCQRHG